VNQIATPSQGIENRVGHTHGRALGLLSSLFFMWGFVSVINNTLLPHLRSVFDLDYTRTTLIESTWFIGYLVASMPAAKIIERVGYLFTLVLGLAIMTLGSLGMVSAAHWPSYGVTLACLFTVSTGITLLQVSANPYVAEIGPPQTAEARLTLVQAFNTCGDVAAIVFGRYLILGRTTGGSIAEGTSISIEQRLADGQATQLPYLMVAVVLAILAVVISRARLPALVESTKQTSFEERGRRSLWKHGNFVFGTGGIFCCVLAEIGVGNLFINFASQPSVGNVTHERAAFYLMFVWAGMMIGRFVGAALMRHVPSERVLAIFSLGAVAAALMATFSPGPTALYALMCIGLFHSIMYPTIFALAIRGLGPLTQMGAGLLVMSVAGGALVFVQGRIADAYGLRWAFLVTAACNLYVLFYALWGCRPTNELPPERLA
jgi:FHS family L-fucose permease-like MFS transporter